MNWIYLLIFNCCLGCFYNGFCLGQMNVISSQVYETYSISDSFTMGLLQSLLTIGGAIGSILSSLLLKSFSRKNCLLLTDLFSIMSIFILYLDESVIALLMSRFLVGVTLGLNAVIIPVYINEMSPKSHVGIFGTMNQFFLTIGILTTFILQSLWNNITISLDVTIPFYKFMLFIPIMPCIIRFIVLQTIFNYETPQYCANNNQKEHLNNILNFIYNEEANLYIDSFKRQNKIIANENSIISLFYNYKKQMIVGCSLTMLQQLGGINGIMFYSSAIFDQITNKAADKVFYLNLIVGIIGVFTAFLATLIIERFGRKQILKYGVLICFFSLLLLSILMLFNYQEDDIGKYLIICSLFSYLFGFGFSLGPLLFIYLTEILPDQGVSVAGFLNWMGGGIVAQMFPIIASFNIGYCFILFTLFNFICFIIIQTKVIETKGLDKQSIEQQFQLNKFDYIPYQAACNEERNY